MKDIYVLQVILIYMTLERSGMSGVTGRVVDPVLLYEGEWGVEMVGIAPMCA